MNKYVCFAEVPNGKKKTKNISVISKDGFQLGNIKFWGAWRQYTFHPNEDTLFDAKCLNEIIEKIDAMNEEIRNEWKLRRKASKEDEKCMQ